MYCHLMVPVDGSTLSAANVETSVQLARRLGARVTFFHAAADLAASGEGLLLKSIRPKGFAEEEIGDTNAVLAKAVASASAAGVMAETVARISDRPAEAIVEAALACNCDLIVMASRGSRGIAGWLHSSATEGVLRRSPLALLVTRVASNEPLTARERALSVIQDEHRSIAVVARGMRELVQHAEESGEPLDLQSLERMLAYMQAFPLQLHHPKEEQYLHRWLRQRAPDCDQLLSDIEAEHVREHALVDETIGRLLEAVSGNPAAVVAVGNLVRTLADAVFRHLSSEERTILPMATKHLQDDDWIEIAEAFAVNNDPGFGNLTANEFRRWLTRITNLLPVARAPT